MVDSVAQELAQRALDFELLTERQLSEVWNPIAQPDLSAEEFRQQLLRRNLLTNYQLEKLFKNERQGLYFGDYKVLYFVGSGTYARVYRAVHRRTNKVVAIKVLRSKFSDDVEQARAFVREGEMVSKLRHPNIVPIYEVFSKGHLHYLVMDFIEGHNLREFLKIRKKFSPLQATSMAADIAAGLAFAFDRKVHHRDLKTSNILVSAKGQAKLVDFGLAIADPDEAEDDDGMSNPRTIDYAGLEKASGVEKDDQRSDIYFLGCIYYNMLSGVPPLVETKDRMLRLSKTRFETVTPIQQIEPDLPRYVISIVNKALELNARLRYQTPQEMLVELQGALHRLKQSGSETDTEVEDNRPLVAPVQRVLMVVESNLDLQNLFREKLKSSGYRVLVTQDPARALARLSEGPKTADCVIFSTGRLGEKALDAYNQLGQHPVTKDLPAVLLLEDGQSSWATRANTADHRVVVSMPIKLREFRATLARLCPTE